MERDLHISPSMQYAPRVFLRAPLMLASPSTLIRASNSANAKNLYTVHTCAMMSLCLTSSRLSSSESTTPLHPPQRDRSLGDGVYFSKTDYIGPSRRIVIVCIDTIVLLMMGGGLSSAWVHVFGHDDGLISALVVMTWLYLVPLKRSAWRTLGYQVAGAKLVNLQGTRPALWLLTLRSLLWVFFFIPCNFLMDVLRCSVDDDRQSIRDRIANTCLVKNRAIPIGSGEVHIAYYFVLGYMFTYSHVVHPNPAHPVSAGR
jgi:uncharacterized RDD family membrane protein YckC